jgi:HPt (histidine-containing phosphotransfer) domain-containing protein
VAAGDTDAMRAVGHKIKSGPAWVGALDLCEIGQRIEDAAGGRSPAGRDELPQLVGRAEASFRAVVVEMDRALVSLEDVGIRRDVP